MRRTLLVLSAGLLAARGLGQEREPDAPWWPQARIGLRVTFGLFSVADGRSRPGDAVAHATAASQSRSDSAHAPPAEYAGLMAQFIARGFDAHEWVRTAKDAGAAYVLFPAKARDGFCLFASRHTECDVVASGHERDMLRDFASACRDEGLRLGLAYAIADSHHDDYLPRPAADRRPTAAADFARYDAYVHSQLTELLDNYAPALVLLYGAEASWTPVHASRIGAALRARTPPVLLLADSAAAPAAAPADAVIVTGLPELQAHDQVLHCDLDRGGDDSAIRALCEAASRGGHLLLGVQADARGSFTAAAVARLRLLGEWLRRNGEAVLGTEPRRLAAELGVATWRSRGDGVRLYLPVLDPPAGGELVLAGVAFAPARAMRLGGEAVPATRRGSDLVIAVPAADQPVPVIAIDLLGPLPPSLLRR